MIKSILLLTGFFAVCALVFISPHLLKSMLPGQTKDPIAGTWVGIVDVRALDHTLPSSLVENTGNAAIRLSLSHTVLTRLNTYKGSGEITDGNGNKEQIEVADLSLLNSGRLAGSLISEPNQGRIGGTLHQQSLTLGPETRTATFHLQGVLHPGDGTKYRQLCSELRSLTEKQNH